MDNDPQIPTNVTNSTNTRKQSLTLVHFPDDDKPISEFCAHSQSKEIQQTVADNANLEVNQLVQRKKSFIKTQYASVSYHGVDIYQAASRGSLPLCVLLWGIASAKKVNLMECDSRGNNPMHFAALAGSPEVVSFFLQQTKGVLSNGIRLVSSMNNDGETPLLRAMRSGIIPVAKVLLDEGSDVFAVDMLGNTIFTTLCQQSSQSQQQGGQLWEMNFMVSHISHFYGKASAQTLLLQPDSENHTPLDWAADQGSVNMLEYLVRRGARLDRTDKDGRGPLYWAVRNHRVAAVSFLVRCGCDPALCDSSGQSPQSLAEKSGHRELLKALKIRSDLDTVISVQNESAELLSESIPDDVLSKSAMHALRRRRSRFGHVLLFAALLCTVWLLSLVVPFYIWIVCVSCGICLFRYTERVVSGGIENMDDERIHLTTFQDVIVCPEKGLGVWLGSVTVYLVYIVSCLFWAEYGENERLPLSSGLSIHMHDPLGLGGIDGEVDDTYLFWTVLSLLVLAIATWLRVAWLDTDPGVVNTRHTDFEEIMSQSLRVSGCPPEDKYCRSTLVRKPIRSKYCTRTGCVVARMDHHCVWLNVTIGHRNHRAFVCFLLTHLMLSVFSTALITRSLHREIVTTLVCDLLSPRFFMVTTLCTFMILISLGLLALTAEQCLNITQNLTVNEKINRARYPYLHGGADGRLNVFDRGWRHNVLEFCQVQGYARDYYTVFVAPTPATTGISPPSILVDAAAEQGVESTISGRHLHNSLSVDNSGNTFMHSSNNRSSSINSQPYTGQVHVAEVV